MSQFDIFGENDKVTQTMSKKALDPRILRTRKLLQQAFFDLLAEKSFDAISVQDIVGRATVNRATFYIHYTDKFALLDHVIGESFEESLARYVGDNPKCKLCALIRATCEFLKKMQATACPREHRQLAPLVESRVKVLIREALLAELHAMKSHRSPADTELAATVASWAIFGASLEWSRNERAASAESFAEQVVPLIVASLKISSGGTCGKSVKKRSQKATVKK